MDEQTEKMTNWVLDRLAELCERIQKHYGVELNAAERSAIGDEIIKQVSAGIMRRSRGG